MFLLLLFLFFFFKFISKKLIITEKSTFILSVAYVQEIKIKEGGGKNISNNIYVCIRINIQFLEVGYYKEHLLL